MLPLTSMLWDESVFPNAREFNPEHFLNDDGNVKKTDQFLPFSTGEYTDYDYSLLFKN